MMTKAERLAEKLRKEKATLVATQQALREQERIDATRHREATRQATNKRRYRVGALADEAGLFRWSDTDLAGLFRVLATLEACPNPVAVLEGVLGEGVEFPE
jgi:hypothetical protein